MKDSVNGIFYPIKIILIMLSFLFLPILCVYYYKITIFLGIAIAISYENINFVKRKINKVIAWAKKEKIMLLILASIIWVPFIFTTYNNEIIFFWHKSLIFLSKNSWVAFLPIILFIWTAISRFMESIADNGYTIKKENTLKGNYTLATFNDAIVKELMHLRLDVTSMKIAQDKQIIKEFNLKDSLTYPDNFELLYRIYVRYPNSAICAHYKTKNGCFAGIIVLLSYTVSELDAPNSYDVETLRIAHAYKRRRLTEGDAVTVHIFDPDIDEKFCMRDRDAKILSIKEDDCYSCLVTLEITILSNDDFDYPKCSRDEPNKKITRKIRFYNDQFFKSSKESSSNY